MTVLEPALKEATDSGEARVLFVLPDFDGLEPGGLDRGREDGAQGGNREPLRLEEARHVVTGERRRGSRRPMQPLVR